MTVNDQVVQKHGELFVVCDERGDISQVLAGAGLYFRDMRYLSYLTLSVEGQQLELLDTGSHAIDHLEMFLTNAGADNVPPHSVTITRRRDLGDRLAERISIINHTRDTLRLPLRVELASDFLDMFAVRGYFTWDREIAPASPTIEGNACTLRYLSPDGTSSVTHVHVPGVPTIVETVLNGPPGVTIVHDLEIAPNGTTDLVHEIVVEIETSDTTERPLSPAGTAQMAHSGMARIVTSNETFNAILERSLADLAALTTPFPSGLNVIAAGIPWYVAPFGRDSLITARQALWLDPATLASTLRLLASVQGERHDPERDEAPGKIVHEMRYGEMARRDIVPFARYYGTVDATPLFLVMLADYVQWTGDLTLFSELRDNVDRALDWIDTSGDCNQDGFVDYHRQGERGLTNQGWKDSWDSLQHLDGSPVPGPIALVEVQGYVYQAKLALAACFTSIGEHRRASELQTAAELLQERIEDEYWLDERRHYAEAIDGDGRRAEALVSNQGHLLAAGVPSEERAADVISSLMADTMRSGWGVRTMATTMPHYNPVSYHRGSVWPHDNAFVLWGFRRYRQFDALDRLATDLFDAAARFPRYRLPELLCGYSRADDPWSTPVAYPTTCSPQAWAAGVPFVIVETLLGLQVNGAARTVHLDPWLPEWLGMVRLMELVVGDARVDLTVSGSGSAVTLQVHDNPCGIDVRLEPGGITES